MTHREPLATKRYRLKNAVLNAVILACITVSIIYAENIAESVRVGMALCAASIIPAVFPFMILSDAIAAYMSFEKSGFLKRLFEKLFKVNGAGLTALICGTLCGFPLGVKTATDLYKRGSISKDEAERLIGFANNTGPAFLIAGVGASMRGSVCDGVFLYLSTVISAVLVGVIFGANKQKSEFQRVNTKQNFDIVSSIKSSAINSLYVCAFIIFFSVVVGLIKIAISDEQILAVVLPFIEIGNAASHLSKSPLTENLSLSLTGFSVAFSGISVHLQSFIFIKETDISVRLYVQMKLLQGLFSAILILIFKNVFI